MEHSPYSYQLLSIADQPLLHAFYQLYADSMPLSERKSEGQIYAMVASAAYSVLLLKEGPVVVGYSVRFNQPETHFYLLEYMAIHADYQNQGLGQSLFLRTVQDLKSPGNSPAYLLLEVDSDLEASADHEIRQKRQRFYQRLGCLRIKNLVYQLPLESENIPPKMDMMIYPLQPLLPVSKAQLRCWLNAIYVDVYTMPQNDPRIHQMLIAVDDPVTFT